MKISKGKKAYIVTFIEPIIVEAKDPKDLKAQLQKNIVKVVKKIEEISFEI